MIIFVRNIYMFVVLHLKYCLDVAESRIKSPSWTMPLNVNCCLTGRYGNFVQNPLNISCSPEHYENKFPNCRVKIIGRYPLRRKLKITFSVTEGNWYILFWCLSPPSLCLFLLGPLLFSFRGGKTWAVALNSKLTQLT